jgi:hypothetical protein
MTHNNRSEKGTRITPEESYALLRATHELGLEETALLCDVNQSTLARAIARAPTYPGPQRRMRAYLATIASREKLSA